jgi:hypothetical protein
MPACARCDLVDEEHVGVYHCIARCVRRAFLCGTVSHSGRDYGHRKTWAGRFKSQPLLDEAAPLACSVYVDLNPIRAEIAATLEESEFTSGRDRIRSLAGLDESPAVARASRLVRRITTAEWVSASLNLTKSPAALLDDYVS